MSFNIEIEYSKLKEAIRKNPQVVASETKDFLYRAGTRLESWNAKTPWRMGKNGGGSPIASGNLLRSHFYKQEPFKGTYYVDENKAPYAPYVHGIKGFPRKRSYQLRPWLEWVKDKSTPQINQDAKRLLDNITESLAK